MVSVLTHVILHLPLEPGYFGYVKKTSKSTQKEMIIQDKTRQEGRGEKKKREREGKNKKISDQQETPNVVFKFFRLMVILFITKRRVFK